MRVRLKILFSWRSRGYNVPIIFSILFTVFPMILIFQQNRLIADQGQISDNQTKLIALQALAEQSNGARQLHLDLNELTGIIADLDAVQLAYNDLTEKSVRVHGRVMMSGVVQNFTIDEAFKNFDPVFCGRDFVTLLPSGPPSVSDCEQSNPFEALRSVVGFIFNDHDYGRHALLLVQFLNAIGQSEHDRLNGTSKASFGQSISDKYLPDIIRNSINSCELNSEHLMSQQGVTIDPNNIFGLSTTLRRIEAAGQQLTQIFDEEGSRSSTDRTKEHEEKAHQLIDILEQGIFDILLVSNVNDQDRNHLSTIEKHLSSSIQNLMKNSLPIIRNACENKRKRDASLLVGLEPTELEINAIHDKKFSKDH